MANNFFEFIVSIWQGYYCQWGVAAYLDDERKEVLLEIVEYLKECYVQYGRAIAYLEQLAGVRAMPRTPATVLNFLLVPQAGVQRGAIVLGNLEPHTLHTMRVTFHRYHWCWWILERINVSKKENMQPRYFPTD